MAKARDGRLKKLITNGPTQMEKRNFIIGVFDGNNISGLHSVEVATFWVLAICSLRNRQVTNRTLIKTEINLRFVRLHSQTPSPKSPSHHSKTSGPNPATMHLYITVPSRSKGTDLGISCFPRFEWTTTTVTELRRWCQRSFFLEGTMQRLPTNDTIA